MMEREHCVYPGLVILLCCLFFVIHATAASQSNTSTPTPRIPDSDIANQEELNRAMAEWAQSAHAETWDNGIGANTTCAKCKSPLNWDPYAPSAGQELNCSSCKRIPGAARPDLESGVPVPKAEWKHISCNICHQPAGDSYLTSLSFWNQETLHYERIDDVAYLCSCCHKGRHGFEVISEQQDSIAHKGWECTACHGSHGNPVMCTNCHNIDEGKGALEHSRHSNVNCSACHDNGGLSLWLDVYPESRHKGELITVRFAHTLTSWPSHNLTSSVSCVRCHHPRNNRIGAIASETSCVSCHPEGASFYWCTGFPRDLDPKMVETEHP
jgi:hypothetical protein